MTGLAARPEPLPRVAGWAVFGVLVVFLAVGVARRFDDRPVLAAVAALGAAAFGAIAILGPRVVLVPASVASGAGVAVLANGSASNVGWFGLCLLAAWCALTASVPVIVGSWAAATLLLVLELVLTTHDPGWAAWLAGTTFSVVGCLFGRRQHDLVVQLREAQAGLAQRARAEERNRIARELHDVIAHSLTVSLLHVGAARLAVADDPDEAERALAEAERLGRASLDEVRHAVGLLHDGGPAATTPLPGGRELHELVDGFRRAGARVDAQFGGDLAGLPATIGLATYRIVQESLTNAVKHAAGRTMHVAVTVDAERVWIRVDSAGAPGSGSGSGLGLVGMRERAQAVGGSCVAGPHKGSWRVSAELPLAARPPAMPPERMPAT